MFIFHLFLERVINVLINLQSLTLDLKVRIGGIVSPTLFVLSFSRMDLIYISIGLGVLHMNGVVYGANIVGMTNN